MAALTLHLMLCRRVRTPKIFAPRWTASASVNSSPSPPFACCQASAACFDEKNDMLSQPLPLTTTTPGGSADVTLSPSTTTRRRAPLSRASASTTVCLRIICATPSASIAQRANAGLPPCTVTVIPVGTFASGHATAMSSLSGTRRMPLPTSSPHACI